MQEDEESPLELFERIINKIDNIETELREVRTLFQHLISQTEIEANDDQTVQATVEQQTTISDLSTTLSTTNIHVTNPTSIFDTNTNNDNPNSLVDSNGVLLHKGDKVKFQSNSWSADKGRIVNITDTRVTVQIRNGQKIVFSPSAVTIYRRANE